MPYRAGCPIDLLVEEAAELVALASLCGRAVPVPPLGLQVAPTAPKGLETPKAWPSVPSRH